LAVAILSLKDAELALAASGAFGVPLLNATSGDRLSARWHGEGDKDWAVMALEQARAGGLA